MHFSNLKKNVKKKETIPCYLLRVETPCQWVNKLDKHCVGLMMGRVFDLSVLLV